jgi:hypothetical protein
MDEERQELATARARPPFCPPSDVEIKRLLDKICEEPSGGWTNERTGGRTSCETAEIARNTLSGALEAGAASELSDQALFEKMAQLGSLERMANAPYSEIRDQYLAAAFASNLRQSLAPAVRPGRKAKPPGRNKSGDADDLTITRDRLVIDLHWLWIRGSASPLPSVKWLSEGDHFDLDSAIAFSAQRQKADKKALAIGISRLEQSYVAVLRTDEVRNRLWSVDRQAARLRVRLMDRLDSPRSRSARNAVPLIVECYRALAIAPGASVTVACTALPHLSGFSIAKAVMKQHLAMLRRLGFDPADH